MRRVSKAVTTMLRHQYKKKRAERRYFFALVHRHVSSKSNSYVEMPDSNWQIHQISSLGTYYAFGGHPIKPFRQTVRGLAKWYPIKPFPQIVRKLAKE